MTDTTHVTEDGILAGLQEVGLTEGDVVFVHSSLSAFGFVEGGADSVIDALLEAVGESGTVITPTFTWSAFHKAESVRFDVNETSCKGDVGIIPETFRLREEAKRSTHVCHSVAAIGPKAEAVLGDDVSSFAAGSVFHALYELDAWCLLLGVEFTSCTELHAVEEYMRVPYRFHRNFAGSTVILADGSETPSQALEFLRYEGYRNDFGKMRAVFERHDALRTAEIGDALVTNVRIRDIFDITRDYMEEDIGFLLDKDSRERLRESRSEGPLT